MEDGYFGCQVNESVEFLQIYDISRLCDGLQDCFMGSDEKKRDLKCTSKLICPILLMLYMFNYTNETKLIS